MPNVNVSVNVNVNATLDAQETRALAQLRLACTTIALFLRKHVSLAPDFWLESRARVEHRAAKHHPHHSPRRSFARLPIRCPEPLLLREPLRPLGEIRPCGGSPPHHWERLPHSGVLPMLTPTMYASCKLMSSTRNPHVRRRWRSECIPRLALAVASSFLAASCCLLFFFSRSGFLFFFPRDRA